MVFRFDGGGYYEDVEDEDEPLSDIDLTKPQRRCPGHYNGGLPDFLVGNYDKDYW